ncbi:hypothetical protein Trydic_g8078 [Trypoxylus dichotomus]
MINGINRDPATCVISCILYNAADLSFFTLSKLLQQLCPRRMCSAWSLRPLGGCSEDTDYLTAWAAGLSASVY